jgi:ParB-like chromosome segregation protein Spo0J
VAKGFFVWRKNMREQHPLSAAFPPMSDEERQELSDSIENIGVQNPITIYEGMVLDGWHRYSIAMELEIDCPEVELDESIDPRDFVLAQNKTRRHVTKSQMALAFAKVYEWAPSGVTRSALGATLKTNQELADIAGTGERTIRQAKKVLQDGDEEVVKAVESGKISAKRGAEIARLPKDKQAAAIDERPEPRPSILDGNAPDEEELRANELAMEADRKLLNDMLDADDPMKLLHEEVTRLNYLVAQKDIRIASLMNEKNTAVKMVKDLQRQLDKINKAKK